MTKTCITALVAVLGLTATLHAQAPQFRNLPSTEIKYASQSAEQLPAPLLTAPGSSYGPAPAAAPSYPYRVDSSHSSCNGCASTCNNCMACNTCGAPNHARFSRIMEMTHRDRPCLEKFWDWLTYRPCETTSFGCCYYMRPIPDGYTWFLYPGCNEGHCAGCCNQGCGCKTTGGCGNGGCANGSCGK